MLVVSGRKRVEHMNGSVIVSALRIFFLESLLVLAVDPTLFAREVRKLFLVFLRGASKWSCAYHIEAHIIVFRRVITDTCYQLRSKIRAWSNCVFARG